MNWTFTFSVLTLILYILQPYLDLRAVRKVLGITLILQIFYLTGHYLAGWPVPTPLIILQICTSVGMGIALGVVFSRVWPISPQPGIERIVRTVLIVIPSLGLGVGLQILLQGNQATQAIYLIFAFSAWLGSGHFIRQEQ